MQSASLPGFPTPPAFKLCYISESVALRERSLEAVLFEAIEAGIDLIQIREKQMEIRTLIRTASRAIGRSAGSRSRVVLNDRIDVALALGAAGVHLGTQSLPAHAARKLVPPGFLVGVSCHSLQEARDAEAAGADYLLLGPVFETPSKRAYGAPLGLERLREVAAAVRTPVVALGGITLERVKPCIAAGATGVAAIRLFQEAPSIRDRVAEVRRLL